MWLVGVVLRRHIDFLILLTVAVKKTFPKLFTFHHSCSIGMVNDVNDEGYKNGEHSHLSLHCHLNVHSIVMYCTKCTN